MAKIYLRKILLLTGVFFGAVLSAQTSGDGLWTMSSSKSAEGEKTNRRSMPSDYFLAKLDLALLQVKLANAPVIHSGSGQPVILEFPNAQGGFEKFAVYESSVMDPALEAKFPMIKTYAAQGIDDPTATMRFSVTQFGFHSMVLSGKRSSCFIDPYTTDLLNYIVYDRAALGADPQQFTCLTEDAVSLPSLQKGAASPLTVQNINDKKLRTYRLAQSCTGEYATIFKGTGTTAQQKANVQAQMVITINRVNGVYERDLAIHMNFVANNDLIIYLLAASDPWTNEWNTTTAQTIDSQIGVNNYDIGHNFNTTGGGNAGCLSCVCQSVSQNNTHKGRGYTGSSNPTGDPFDIDYVAHEMGHQFGGYHVMNTCSRSGSGSTEVEPASGSSIMGYAGICPTNVQSNSHDDFNYVNIRDISANIKTGNSTCAVITNLTNNPPSANAGADYVIPKSTPFILEGSGSDPDGNASLTYNWSQNDPAQSPGTGSPQSTYAVGPMYRAIPPTTVPVRYMPAIATVIANNVSSTWEMTPSVGRDLNFSFIVRDNAAGGGQTASDLMKVTVNGTAGPFQVTSQTSATTWTAGTTQTITWAVAGTTATPVSTPSVNILLSLDGGYTYPVTIASNRPNNGSASITVPTNTTNTGRIMVRGAGNIFYDLNNGVITIKPGVAVTPVSNFSVASTNMCTGTPLALTDQSTNAPTTWTWSATSSTGVSFSNANTQNPTVTFANAGTYTLSLVAANASGSSTSTRTVTINATPNVAVNSATICSGNAASLTASGATSYAWNTSATTAAISVSPASTTSYTVTGTSNGCTNSKVSTVSVNATPTVSANNASVCNGNPAVITASGATTYAWSTSATTASISVTPATTTNYTVTGTSNGCSSAKVVTVTVNTTPTVAVNSSTICSGTSASLNASGATTYSWSTSATTAGITVSPATTTSYTVTGSNGSCTNTKVTTVTVKATPSVSANNASVCDGNAAVITASGAASYAWSTSATTASISVSPSATTNYTVTGTTNGCSDTKVVTVTINSTPTVAVTNATVCAGSPAVLTASGASTYNWSNSATTASISVSPSSSTSYTVTGFNGSCQDVQVANVTVNALPSVVLTVPATVVCINAPAIALTGNPVGGTFAGSGISGSVFDPATAGAGTFTLSYTYTDGNACANSDQKVITVSLCTGIESLDQSGFLVYPNPTSGSFTIEFAATLENVKLEVFDAIGKLVVAQRTVNSGAPVSLEDFAKGIYTVRISHEGTYNMIRIVKQ